MRIRRTIMLVAIAASIAGCTGQSHSSSSTEQTAASPAAALKNPSDFPLVADAKILDVKPFSQTVAAGQGQASMLGAQGAGTYNGDEVLASTTMSSKDLSEWLAGLGQKPPTGFVYETGSATASGKVSQTLALYGISYAAFRSADKAINRGVVIVAMDPSTVREKLGLALGLVERYRSLPSALRDPIDQQIKAKTGFTATEATDPSSPLGMTLSALHELENSGTRAIVMVDGTKK